MPTIQDNRKTIARLSPIAERMNSLLDILPNMEIRQPVVRVGTQVTITTGYCELGSISATMSHEEFEELGSLSDTALQAVMRGFATIHQNATKHGCSIGEQTVRDDLWNLIGGPDRLDQERERAYDARYEEGRQ